MYQILHVGRYAGRNHLCKNWGEKIKGFGIYGGQILGSSIEMAGHPYNSAALLRNLRLRYNITNFIALEVLKKKIFNPVHHITRYTVIM